MRRPLAGLWRHPDFLKLWAGQTVSDLGSMVTGTALPLTTILALGATPMQVGLLAAAESLPVLLLGLPAGVWVDRLRRRPVLIAADLGRALLLATIPAAAALGALRVEHLYVVAVLAGALTVFFDVAYRSFLPAIVAREQLVEGNGKLGASSSAAEIAGPALGGTLVQLVGGPIAILLDVVSFLCSATAVGLIRTKEPPPAAEQRQSLGREVVEGLRVVARDPILRALLGASATFSLAGGVVGSLYFLYGLNELGLQPAVVGAIVGVGGAFALPGALAAGWTSRRLGLGPAIVWTYLAAAAAQLLIPLAGGPPGPAVALLALAQAGDVALAVYFVHEVSLRQALAPERLLGRVNASAHFLGGGAAPAGALLGGILGQTIGLRPTMAVGVLGLLLSCLWLVFSPIPGLRTLPRTGAQDREEAGGEPERSSG